MVAGKSNALRAGGVALGLAVFAAAPGQAAVAMERVVPVAASSVVLPAAAAPDSVTPISRAAAPVVVDLASESDFVAKLPEPAAMYHPMVRPVFAGLSIAEIIIYGGAVMALVIFARRRHRRRVGWGVIPERPSIWSRFAD